MIGPIKLDTNKLGYIFIDQDDPESPFGTRVILTPEQVQEIIRFVASPVGQPLTVEDVLTQCVNAMKERVLCEAATCKECDGWRNASYFVQNFTPSVDGVEVRLDHGVKE